LKEVEMAKAGKGKRNGKSRGIRMVFTREFRLTEKERPEKKRIETETPSDRLALLIARETGMKKKRKTMKRL